MSIEVVGGFQAWTGYLSNREASVELTLQSWTATGTILPTEPSFELWTGEILLDPGQLIVVDATAERMTGSVALADMDVLVTMDAAFEPWTSNIEFTITIEAAAQEWTSDIRVDSPIVLSGAWEAWEPAGASMYGVAEVWTGTMMVAQAVGAVFHVANMNTRTKGVTEYSNFAFNSFAKIGNRYYAVGAVGLVRLGTSNLDDATGINWTIRTGQMDDNTVQMKRLPEIVLGLRSNGRVKVRVHPSDTKYYDYVLPAYNTGTIRQHRVKPGKGMRSRWYSVELQSMDANKLELSSAQINMEPVNRRIG